MLSYIFWCPSRPSDTEEFEFHEESDKEPSEGEISEEEDDDNDNEDEDWDDSDDSDARSDDKYRDWDDIDYRGPWNNDEDNESGYYSPRDPAGYSVYAIDEDDPMVDPKDAIQSTLTISMKGDESASNSKDSKDIKEYEIIIAGNVDPIAE
ncbi:acidic leucine-rich nuclear phosphoprotein 32 family member E-like [Macadamia integrifolia]|uniref:acidic leucine-rich nuclear phosphoprotein 32 family member E-like n=1 Tax=Macadamia integrifolia TaxID=60698 RepID=UPI001C4FBADA|nr:acidic leucine-rich nuclear phosphoprotein 32 family member E-like [Macadamia integrifolia]